MSGEIVSKKEINVSDYPKVRCGFMKLFSLHSSVAAKFLAIVSKLHEGERFFTRRWKWSQEDLHLINLMDSGRCWNG